ncbi:MAG: hypothetical protein RSC08_02355 [Oscillospiraceae bacterium]
MANFGESLKTDGPFLCYITEAVAAEGGIFSLFDKSFGVWYYFFKEKRS